MKFPIPNMDETLSKRLQAVYRGDEASADQTEALAQSKQGSLVRSFQSGNECAQPFDLFELCVECPGCWEWVTLARLFRQGDCSLCNRVLLTGYRLAALRGVKRMNIPLRLFELLEAEPYAEVICDS